MWQLGFSQKGIVQIFMKDVSLSYSFILSSGFKIKIVPLVFFSFPIQPMKPHQIGSKSTYMYKFYTNI